MVSRGIVYIILLFLGAIFEFYIAYSYSVQAYENGDRSAYAWMGFLPFFIPIFFIRPLIVAAVVVPITELCILGHRIYENKVNKKDRSTGQIRSNNR